MDLNGFETCNYCGNTLPRKEFFVDSSHLMDTCQKCCGIVDTLRKIISLKDAGKMSQAAFKIERGLLLQKIGKKVDIDS